MSKKILLKTKGENNKIRFAVTDNNELVFQGVYSEDFLYCDNICSVRVKDRVPAQKSVFCDAGQDRTAFIGDCNLNGSFINLKVIDINLTLSCKNSATGNGKLYSTLGNRNFTH